MCCFTYLKYGPCRPETRLAVGVQIQTENATHLVSQVESTAWIVLKNTIQTCYKLENSVCVQTGGGEKLKYTTTQVCFSCSDPAHQPNHASLHTSESKGVEERPNAAAPYGVQLQSLINWMLRFHVGNPREIHHLQLKEIQWRHQCPAHKRGTKGARYLVPTVSAALVSLLIKKNKKCRYIHKCVKKS